MQLASSARIPDGFMAAMRLGGEKPHQGLPGRNPALYQGPTVCNSTTALGLQTAAVLNRIGSCSTGKERDTESGNDYFFARYYSSAMGRFLSPDWAAKAWPVPYAKLDDPQTLNLYGYLRNNPLGGVDADGHCGAGANDPPCQKQADNPASHVSAETKAQIKDAVAATKKPSGDDKKGGFHEEAGISYTQDGKQVQAPATPGAYKDVTTPGPATSDPYKTADPSKAKPGDVQADVDYHTHPNGTATTTSLNPSGQTVQTTSSFNQPPSAVDIQNASPAPTLNIVVGTGNNTVYFYTGAGTTCTESLKDFYKPQ
jgi:RHS repeat-associated protein